MTQSQNTIVVAGATGQQGGAVARQLLADGWSVRALTRDPASDRAKALSADGAQLVQGNLDDSPSLEAALRGVHGVFGVQNFALPGVGAEGEVRQGLALANAARAAGVRHFVYSSVGGAERNSGIPHFESKWQVEQHIRALDLPHTMLRPVAFMENYNGVRPVILGGVFPTFGLRPEKTLQLLALDDLGAFAAIAFAHPDEYLGRALELAGDELTAPQIAAVFSRVLGRPVQVDDQLPNGGDPDSRRERDKMLRWFNERGYVADIGALRRIHPGLLTLEAWARRTGWKQDVEVLGGEENRRSVVSSEGSS